MTMRIVIKNDEAPESGRVVIVTQVDKAFSPDRPSETPKETSFTEALMPGQTTERYLHRGNYVTIVEKP